MSAPHTLENKSQIIVCKVCRYGVSNEASVLLKVSEALSQVPSCSAGEQVLISILCQEHLLSDRLSAELREVRHRACHPVLSTIMSPYITISIFQSWAILCRSSCQTPTRTVSPWSFLHTQVRCHMLGQVLRLDHASQQAPHLPTGLLHLVCIAPDQRSCPAWDLSESRIHCDAFHAIR